MIRSWGSGTYDKMSRSGGSSLGTIRFKVSEKLTSTFRVN
jgi:catalase (peroxidase I)